MKELIIFVNKLGSENADNLKNISWFAKPGDEHFDNAVGLPLNDFEVEIVADNGYLSKSLVKWQEKLKAIKVKN